MANYISACLPTSASGAAEAVASALSLTQAAVFCMLVTSHSRWGCSSYWRQGMFACTALQAMDGQSPPREPLSCCFAGASGAPAAPATPERGNNAMPSRARGAPAPARDPHTAGPAEPGPLLPAHWTRTQAGVAALRRGLDEAAAAVAGPSGSGGGEHVRRAPGDLAGSARAEPGDRDTWRGALADVLAASERVAAQCSALRRELAAGCERAAHAADARDAERPRAHPQQGLLPGVGERGATLAGAGGGAAAAAAAVAGLPGPDSAGGPPVDTAAAQQFSEVRENNERPSAAVAAPGARVAQAAAGPPGPDGSGDDSPDAGMTQLLRTMERAARLLGADAGAAAAPISPGAGGPLHAALSHQQGCGPPRTAAPPPLTPPRGLGAGLPRRRSTCDSPGSSPGPGPGPGADPGAMPALRQHEHTAVATPERAAAPRPRPARVWPLAGAPAAPHAPCAGPPDEVDALLASLLAELDPGALPAGAGWAAARRAQVAAGARARLRGTAWPPRRRARSPRGRAPGSSSDEQRTAEPRAAPARAYPSDLMAAVLALEALTTEGEAPATRAPRAPCAQAAAAGAAEGPGVPDGAGGSGAGRARGRRARRPGGAPGRADGGRGGGGPGGGGGGGGGGGRRRGGRGLYGYAVHGRGGGARAPAVPPRADRRPPGRRGAAPRHWGQRCAALCLSCLTCQSLAPSGGKHVVAWPRWLRCGLRTCVAASGC